MKSILIIFLACLLIFTVSASDEQAVQICGGDQELVAICTGGDEQIGYFHNYEDEVITLFGGGIPRITEKRNLVIYIVCVVALILILIFFWLFGKRRKKKNQDKFIINKTI